MSAVTPDITINGTLVSPATIPQEEHESYFQLVWRRFRRSKVSIVGGLMVVGLVFLAAFANFFSPTDISKVDLKSSFIPPQQVNFIEQNGTFHLVPFVYNYTVTLDKSFRPIAEEYTRKAEEIDFFVQGPEYKLLGRVPISQHVYRVRHG